MSNDSFSTTTSTSWFGRIGNALAGILFGVVLFLGSFVLLSWNEGRAIHRAKTLEAGAAQVITIPADAVLAENEGKLVHLTGEAAAEAPVEDPVFGISVAALKLRRNVEMFQWQQTEKSETKQKLGGGEETTTTYTYAKGWSSMWIDSSQFHAPAGHENPASMPVESETFVAEDIHVGPFLLPPALVERINNFQSRPATAEDALQASRLQDADLRTTTGGALYLGKNASQPEIGDLRITFEVAPVGPVSILAAQVGNTFEPFAVGTTGTIEVLQTGTFSAAEMFRQEQESNTLLTWLLRLGGFVMMLIGILMITNIFQVLASVIPFLGNLVGLGTGLLALAVALPLSLITIAVAWLAYRPLFAIPLLLLAAVSVYFAIKKIRARRPATA